MKKLYTLFFSALLMGGSIIAQPTFNFETGWTGNPLVTPAFDVAKGWVSNNILANSVLGSNPISVYKSTDAHSGSFACEINTVRLSNPPGFWNLQDTIGYMANGVATLVSPYIFLGDTQTQRPATFEFWAKYTPNGTDTAYAAVLLQKRISAAQVDTIGAGIALVTGTVSSYSKFVMPIVYNSAHLGVNPDSMIIVFSSSGNIKPQVGSKFIIDDLTFGFTTGLDELSAEGDVKVFPNPATEEINFNFSKDLVKNVMMVNAFGQEVGKFEVKDKNLQINTTKFASGVYFYTISGDNDRILRTGKVTVTH